MKVLAYDCLSEEELIGNYKIFVTEKKQWIICIINCDFIWYNKNFKMILAQKAENYFTATSLVRFCKLDTLYGNDKGSKNSVKINGDL